MTSLPVGWPSSTMICGRCQQSRRTNAVIERGRLSLPAGGGKIGQGDPRRGGYRFSKTHDIAALVGLLPAGHRLKDKVKSLEKLTPYGVAYRYPSEDDWDVPTVASIETWRSEIAAIRSMI